MFAGAWVAVQVAGAAVVLEASPAAVDLLDRLARERERMTVDAVIHAEDRVSDRGDEVEIVRDHEDGHALAQGREVAADDPLGVSEMEQMMSRGRQALVGALSQPQVVGYLWGHYGHGDIARDGPFTKGLLDEVGRINHAHVQVLSAINRQALALRATAWG